MPKTPVMYGIKNCDTVKKARAWLEANGVEYDFFDYKAEGAPRDRLEAWVKTLGWEAVLNRAGMTFRKLPDAKKEGLTERKAMALMLEQPSMIKRPLVERNGKLILGFRPETYEKAFGRDRQG